MTDLNLKTLCTALGFAAVAMQEHIDPERGSMRAQTLANLIEEFCLTIPSAEANREMPYGAKFYDDKQLLIELTSALELCLSCNGQLTWEAEQEAAIILSRAKEACHGHA